MAYNIAIVRSPYPQEIDFPNSASKAEVMTILRNPKKYLNIKIKAHDIILVKDENAVMAYAVVDVAKRIHVRNSALARIDRYRHDFLDGMRWGWNVVYESSVALHVMVAIGLSEPVLKTMTVALRGMLKRYGESVDVKSRITLDCDYYLDLCANGTENYYDYASARDDIIAGFSEDKKEIAYQTASIRLGSIIYHHAKFNDRITMEDMVYFEQIAANMEILAGGSEIVAQDLRNLFKLHELI